MTKKCSKYLEDCGLIDEPMYAFTTTIQEKWGEGRLPEDFDLIPGVDYLEYGLLEQSEIH
jgi:hypothetical protein